MTLATRLRTLRATKKWTQEQAAKEIGTTTDNLAQIEKGRRHPRLSTLSRIADAYGVDVGELIALEDARPISRSVQDSLQVEDKVEEALVRLGKVREIFGAFDAGEITAVDADRALEQVYRPAA